MRSRNAAPFICLGDNDLTQQFAVSFFFPTQRIKKKRALDCNARQDVHDARAAKTRSEQPRSGGSACTSPMMTAALMKNTR
ncbi:MAG TPA: hypothetical protein VF478_07585 [Anaerolineae bacterium]